MNDRRIAERVIHANLMIVVISGGIDYARYPEVKDLEELFRQEIYDLLSQLDQKRGDKLYARALRATKHASAPYVLEEKASPAKLGLITFYLLQNLVGQGYVEFNTHSPFTVAIDQVLPLLQEHADIDALNASAKKQARRMYETLQRDGYYAGTKWSDLNVE